MKVGIPTALQYLVVRCNLTGLEIKYEIAKAHFNQRARFLT